MRSEPIAIEVLEPGHGDPVTIRVNGVDILRIHALRGPAIQVDVLDAPPGEGSTVERKRGDDAT